VDICLELNGHLAKYLAAKESGRTLMKIIQLGALPLDLSRKANNVFNDISYGVISHQWAAACMEYLWAADKYGQQRAGMKKKS